MAVDFAPGCNERFVAPATTFGTGSVSGRKGSGLIKKEQMGVAARCHQCPLPVVELQGAGDPVLMLVLAVQNPVLAVQDAAISCQRAPAGNSLDFAIVINAVLQWHGQVLVPFGLAGSSAGHALQPQQAVTCYAISGADYPDCDGLENTSSLNKFINGTKCSLSFECQPSPFGPNMPSLS